MRVFLCALAFVALCWACPTLAAILGTATFAAMALTMGKGVDV